jgi:hypothetical protein
VAQPIPCQIKYSSTQFVAVNIIADSTRSIRILRPSGTIFPAQASLVQDDGCAWLASGAIRDAYRFDHIDRLNGAR